MTLDPVLVHKSNEAYKYSLRIKGQQLTQEKNSVTDKPYTPHHNQILQTHQTKRKSNKNPTNETE